MQLRKLWNNWIVKNLALGVVFVLGIALAASILLSVRTRHGKELILPDFTSMTFEEASGMAALVGVRVVAGDSVYIPRMRKDGVYSQNPKPGMKVKKGRRVILTVNSRNPELISMPSLLGYQLHQAKSELLSKGLKLGKLSYVPDIATNNVLEQCSEGSVVLPGSKILVGSTIDLTLGLSSSDSKTIVPNLVGIDYARAVDMLQDNSLNVGRVVFDRTVKSYGDTLQAVVYEQSPAYSSQIVTMGSRISIKLTTDHSKLEE